MNGINFYKHLKYLKENKNNAKNYIKNLRFIDFYRNHIENK